ncbi:hypothetical protein RT97_04900 [Variovorax paradoxus]|uniref:Uncharacterized protein n=1 Tax=Variovorax paradoxus TaxID=34073 RepID=A0A0D0N1L8_VARPD|nr:hypothetical protein [Variovorax paradoxus]KIQ35255.1 hypothetical protein RT97_04900 [Variovorax paradoxus]
MKPFNELKPMTPMSPSADRWWPSELAHPSSTGSQDGVRYAFFPEPRRLVVEQQGKVKQYDTGAHQITGVSQQQRGIDDRTLIFVSQDGPVALASLPEVD